MPEARLFRPFIVSGPHFPMSQHLIAPDSIELVASAFFVMEGKDGKTLVMTDECGVLRSIDAKFNAVPKFKQHPVQQPMELHLIPKGVAATTFIADGESWQKELMQEINQQFKDPNVKLKSITTIPIRFGKQHLKKPHDFADDETKKIYNEQFVDGQEFYKYAAPPELKAGTMKDGARSPCEAKARRRRFLSPGGAECL